MSSTVALLDVNRGRQRLLLSEPAVRSRQRIRPTAARADYAGAGVDPANPDVDLGVEPGERAGGAFISRFGDESRSRLNSP